MRLYLIDKLKKKSLIGLVSGSDISKIDEQLGGPERKTAILCFVAVLFLNNNLIKINLFFFYLDTAQFDYVFSENGLVAFKNGTELKRQVC